MFATSTEFWQSAESWYQGQVNAQGQTKGVAYGVTPAARKAAAWRSRGDRYLRHTGLSSGWVRVDPVLQGHVLELMDGIAPALSASYDEHLGALAMSAFSRWPVFTGLSKGLLALEYVTSDGGAKFRGTIESRAPYTVFIKGQPHRVLIERPAADIVGRIAADGFSELARTL